MEPIKLTDEQWKKVKRHAALLSGAELMMQRAQEMAGKAHVEMWAAIVKALPDLDWDNNNAYALNIQTRTIRKKD